MTRPLHILLAASSAPPKNSPEAIQVGRFLEALDPAVRVTLVTTPVVAGWETGDATMQLHRPGLRRIEARLPLHRFTQRILANHRLARWHAPDADFWLPHLSGRIVREVGSDLPDVIYSRSAPFSNAALALRLKQRLGIPWLMHLSDPWAASPYRPMTDAAAAKDQEIEAQCCEQADRITLTTEGQAEAYRQRNPSKADVIGVAPNMLPALILPLQPPVAGERLRLVHTGALYGARNPHTLILAMALLARTKPDLARRIDVDFYGNAANSIAAQIMAAPNCRFHGQIPLEGAVAAQRDADVLVTIEPDGESPLMRHFMPSKNLDYVASGKSILAITPHGSETARLCAQGFGWSVAPGDVETLAQCLEDLVLAKQDGTLGHDRPEATTLPYGSAQVSAAILRDLQRIAGRN